jgi:ATP-dependent RNA helicase DeaD
MEFNRFLDYYKQAPDLNIQEEKEVKSKGEYVPKKSEKGYKWVKLSVGSKHSVTTRHIIRMMCSLGVGKKGIGLIEVKRSESFVEIASSAAQYVVEQTNGTLYKGKNLFSEIVKIENPANDAKPSKGGRGRRRR